MHQGWITWNFWSLMGALVKWLNFLLFTGNYWERNHYLLLTIWSIWRKGICADQTQYLNIFPCDLKWRAFYSSVSYMSSVMIYESCKEGETSQNRAFIQKDVHSVGIFLQIAASGMPHWWMLIVSVSMEIHFRCMSHSLSSAISARKP